MTRPPASGPDGRHVRQMFDAVAPRYDFLNRLLSGGLDRRWRRRAADVLADRLAEHPAGPPCRAPLVVDLCTGTGDMALAVLRRLRDSRLVCCDFSRPMLARAQAKFSRAGLAGRAALVEADILALPLADGAADAATCAFGVRNAEDPLRCLAEMVRIVRPGGRVVILEFHWPQGRGVLADLFGLYFRRILPRLGTWLSGGGHRGYHYLVDSIDAFGPPQRTAALMVEAGLMRVRIEPLPAAVASVFSAER